MPGCQARSATAESQPFQTGGSEPVLVALGGDQFRVDDTVNGQILSGTITH